MDIATIIGWLLSIGAVALLIVDQDQIQMFFGSRTAIVSIIFVLGGTVSGTMMRYSMAHFISSLGVVAKIFSSGDQDPEKPKWLATLPLEFGEEIIEIEVEIEGSPRRPDDESSGWKLEFLLELKSLGPVRVSLEMRNGRLGIDFSVTASINERLDGALPILRDRLLASGLQLDHVSTSVFKAESEGEIRASQVRLDISV